jgi:hypothetical protein
MNKPLRAGVFAACCVLAAACRPARPALGPVPAEIHSVEGYASIRYSRGGGSAKSRLAFLLVPPGGGRLEALGPLNRSLFQVFIDEPDAVLVVPSKKAYWRGPRPEVLDSGLGFSLSLEEIAGILCGRFDGPAFRSGWALDRDGERRVSAGRGKDFEFRVDEFFGGSTVPRRLTFLGSESSGTLTLLSLDFNSADADARIRASLPPGFARLSRAEMEKLLRDEN